MRFKLTFVAFATLFTLLLPHGDLQATEAEDKAAFDDCLPKARTGDAECQMVIAETYGLGLGGVNQDYAQAVSWYRKAAEQGDAMAQYSLSV